MVITEFKIHENATNLAWSLRIDKIRQNQIDALMEEILREMIAGEGTSEAEFLSRLNERLNTLQELLYATSKIEAYINY